MIYRVKHPDGSTLETDCRERAEQSARRFGGEVEEWPWPEASSALDAEDRAWHLATEEAQFLKMEQEDKAWLAYEDEINSHYTYDDGTMRFPGWLK